MRPIEFRAWDKTRNEYLSAGKVLISIHRGKNPVNKIWLDILKSPDSYKDRFVLEQFTGLRGNGDTKIYDGDICKVSFADGSKHIAKVKFNDGCFDFEFPKSPSGKFRDYVKCYTVNHAVVVIGNIHENPELLTKESA